MIQSLKKEHLLDSILESLCNYNKIIISNINSIEFNRITGIAIINEINDIDNEDYSSFVLLNQVSFQTGDHLLGHLAIINEELSDFTIKIN